MTVFAATVIAVFSSIAVLVIAIDFYFSHLCFQQPEKIGKLLGLSALFAGIVTISYVISVRTDSFFLRSLSSSIYFACIDWMLVTLVNFTYLFTGRLKTKKTRTLECVIVVAAVIDTIVFIANIFTGISVEYIPRDTPIAPFTYGMKPLYVAHLIFTYILVASTIYILGAKIAKTPRQYRNQYWLIIITILGVVLVNAIFLYPREDSIHTMLDWSIFVYSVALVIVYWAAFEYRHKNMLESLSMTIFQNINQGIVLFDYEEELIMKNLKAEHLFPEVKWPDRMQMDDFLKQAGIPSDHEEDNYSLQCCPDGRNTPIRCDASKLRDYTGAVTGNLLVFTEPDISIDLLTGFENWEHFHRFLAENPYDFDHPTAVAVFDIIGLGRVNNTFGHEVGDQRIRNLVAAMRKFLPSTTCFVRGYEAHLIAVCQHATEDDLIEQSESVCKACGGTVLYGLSMTEDSSIPDQNPKVIRENSGIGRNVVQAIDTALHALQTKKLLHTDSIHSQTLTSLVRALQESDSDTEEHVKRTQKMGAMLGRRVGLTDAEQADLSLLCLLHDIGKIGIPLEILNKPGKLTDSEWGVLKTHAEKGYEIAMSSDELKDIAVYILHHHERWDGNGYPEKLAGGNIPLLSRIISIVDAYDAMVNTRSYRKAMPPEDAQAEVERCSGSQFDPYLASEFLDMLAENPDIMYGEKTGGEIRVFRQIDASKIAGIPAVSRVGSAIINSAGKVLTDGSAAGAIVGNATSSVPFCHYILDLDDHIVEVDSMFTDITGYTRDDAIGRMSQFDLIAAEDKAFYISQVNDQFANGSIAYLKHDIIRKDGTRVNVHCIGKRYYDSVAKSYRSEIIMSEA